MQPTAPIRAVLYDFDGTLADSTELIMRCYRHTMRTHLGAAPPDAEWLSGFGTPLETQIERFARTSAEREAMLETYLRHQVELHDRLLRPFPGAAATVAALAARGIRLAIVTSKRRRATLRGIELCRLAEHFATIVTPDEVRHAKPHPEPVLRALEELGVEPEAALFVGDSPHDIAAGRAAGTRTAAALWGPFPRAVLETAGPDHLLREQAEVLRLVEEGNAAGPGAPAVPAT